MIEEHKIIEKFRSARNYLDVIYDKSNWWDNCDKLEKAITELERLQQKETPMKVDLRISTNEPYTPLDKQYCPSCYERLSYENKYNYCPHCGQHLDWSDEK